MIERLHLSTLILIAALLWAALLALEGVAITAAWFRPFSVVIALLLLLLTAFDLYLWRLPFLQAWFVKRPLLDGTWKADVRSNWKNPDTGKAIDPIEGFMVIRQTFSRLSLRLLTDESQSELLGADLIRADDGTYRVVGVYRSEPKLTVRDRSPIHYGGLALQVIGKPPRSLEGHYWTDRDTAGAIALTDRRSMHLEDVAAAHKVYAVRRR